MSFPRRLLAVNQLGFTAHQNALPEISIPPVADQSLWINTGQLAFAAGGSCVTPDTPRAVDAAHPTNGT